jgi:hypothetical protein
MNPFLRFVEQELYSKLDFRLSDLRIDTESQDYDACTFKLKELRIISRSSKTTPIKTGQFVTFWKRLKNGPIAPFDASDDFDFLVVNAQNGQHFGQFVFPKLVLMNKGIISTTSKEGKRAFRVYPIWDVATSQQAIKSQKWQLQYFHIISTSSNLDRAKELYSHLHS